MEGPGSLAGLWGFLGGVPSLGLEALQGAPPSHSVPQGKRTGFCPRGLVSTGGDRGLRPLADRLLPEVRRCSLRARSACRCPMPFLAPGGGLCVPSSCRSGRRCCLRSATCHLPPVPQPQPPRRGGSQGVRKRRVPELRAVSSLAHRTRVCRLGPPSLP